MCRSSKILSYRSRPREQRAELENPSHSIVGASGTHCLFISRLVLFSAKRWLLHYMRDVTRGTKYKLQKLEVGSFLSEFRR